MQRRHGKLGGIFRPTRASTGKSHRDSITTEQFAVCIVKALPAASAVHLPIGTKAPLRFAVSPPLSTQSSDTRTRTDRARNGPDPELPARILTATSLARSTYPPLKARRACTRRQTSPGTCGNRRRLTVHSVDPSRLPPRNPAPPTTFNPVFHALGRLTYNLLAAMKAARSLARLSGLSHHPNKLACRVALNHGAPAHPRSSSPSPSQTPWQSRRWLSSRNLGGLKGILRISDEVSDAVTTNKPVVALESTIYTHGALGPDLKLEAIVRENGGVPAVIGILDGVPTVGLTPEELERMVNAGTAAKASRRDLAYLTGMVSLLSVSALPFASFHAMVKRSVFLIFAPPFTCDTRDA